MPTGQQEESSVPKLIFDGDCAFCTTTAQWLAARLARGDGTDAEVTPWQFTDLAALGTTAERTRREVLWVRTDGTIFGGAAAIAAGLRHHGGPIAVLGRVLTLPVVRTVAAAVYRLVARNRSRLPGGSPACALPPPGGEPPAS